MTKQAKMAAESPTLGDFIDALSGIIGHQVPANLFVGRVLADALGKDPGAFTRMRQSRTTAPLELLKLLRIFRLERVIDYRIFQSPDIDTFHAELRRHGVGIYGGSSRAELLGRFAALARTSKASISLRVMSRPATRARGLGPPEADDPAIPVLVRGSTVRLECNGVANRHILIFQHVGGDEVDVLAPSRFVPNTLARHATTVVPTADSDHDVLHVGTEPGYCRLYAAWVDSTVAQRMHIGIVDDTDVTKLDDPTASALCRLLESAAQTLVATMTFRVTDVGS